MDLRFSDQDEAFRAEARAWLTEQLDGDFAGVRGRGGPGDEHALFDERLAWEQHLTTRLTGAPLVMEVIIDAESILHQTMYLFAGAFVAAVLVLITIIWLVIRRGRVRLRELQR